jgi:oligoribonuclease NrnB/cAMP/cGMP phosphodiesterase (DHH superfamily)
MDGFTAAWVAHNALVKEGHVVTLLAMDYTLESTEALYEELTDTHFAHLYVVDFSLKMSVLSRLFVEHVYLLITILDHHKSAFKEYAPSLEVKDDTRFVSNKGNTKIILDNGKSGAGMCWEWFAKTDRETDSVPELVMLVQDRDLWKFRWGNKAKHLHQYLLTQEKTIAKWDDISENLEIPDGAGWILGRGKDLLAHHNNRVSFACTQAEDIVLGGIVGLAICCEQDLASDVGHQLAEKSGTFGACYTIDQGDHCIKWSLRSIKGGDFDVSDLAAKYGGGGHKNAAGFVSKLTRQVGR